MSILELTSKLGIDPKRVASTNGGEYHSSCPKCGGKDRFIIWPIKDRYFCRQCKTCGDAIQFCRDFFDMSFQEASSIVGKNASEKWLVDRPFASRFKEVITPPISWKSKAAKFIARCHDRLLVDKTALSQMMARGLSLKTVERFQIGWNPSQVYERREQWGLDKKVIEDKEKKLFLPKGIVIPSFSEELPCKIKIRCADWSEGVSYGKYYEIPGSSNRISVFGNTSKKIIVLVESELDAILTIQEAGDLCCCIALGGAQKRPDEETHQWLRAKSFIMFALDFDDSGKKEFNFWNNTYPNLKAWPVPKEKSPGDAHGAGVNLHAWIDSGLKYYGL